MEQPIGSEMPASPRSNLLTIVLTILITAIVVIAGMYVFGFAGSTSTDVAVENATPTPTPTVAIVGGKTFPGWKVYANAKYGFEFEYPFPGWEIKNRKSTNQDIIEFYDPKGLENWTQGITLIFEDHGRPMSLEETWDIVSRPFSDFVKKGELTVDGYPAYNVGPLEDNEGPYDLIIDNPSDSGFSFLQVWPAIGEAMYQRILSTFKFTK